MNTADTVRYDVSWKLMDTSEYSGLPHHRSRVFIVGILKSKQKGKINWPEKARTQCSIKMCKLYIQVSLIFCCAVVAVSQVPMRPLDEFLDPKLPRHPKSLKPTALQHVRDALQSVVEKGDNPCDVHYVVDIGGACTTYF